MIYDERLQRGCREVDLLTLDPLFAASYSRDGAITLRIMSLDPFTSFKCSRTPVTI